MYENELYHHGVKGMRWGHRKSQPVSGSRGRMQSAKADYKSAKKTYNKSFNKAYRNSQLHPVTQFATKKGRAKSDALWNQANTDAKRVNSTKSKYKQEKKAYKQTDEYKAKRAKYIKTGAAVAGTALAVYGAYKLNKYVKSTNFKYHQEIGEKIYNDYIKNSKLAVRAHTLSYESAMAGVGSRASERSYKVQQVLSRNALDRRASEIAKANTDNFVTAARNTYNYRKKHR